MTGKRIAIPPTKETDITDTPPINLNGRTRLHPLLGDPIVYARSPDWLSKHMAKRGMNGISLPMEVKDGDVASAVLPEVLHNSD